MNLPPTLDTKPSHVSASSTKPTLCSIISHFKPFNTARGVLPLHRLGWINFEQVIFYCPSGKTKSSRSLNAILSDAAERATEPSYQLRWQCPWAIWSPCNLTFGETSAKKPSAAGLAIKEAAFAGISFFFSVSISRRRCRSWIDDEIPSAFLKLRDA